MRSAGYWLSPSVFTTMFGAQLERAFTPLERAAQARVTRVQHEVRERRALRYSRRSSDPSSMITDGDNQYPQERIADLVAPIVAGGPTS